MSSAPSPKGLVLHRICPQCDTEVREERQTCPTCNSKLIEVRDEIDNVVGTVIDGRFEIRAKLGQGGMGTVYRAWQKSVGREVAVKLIDRSYSRDPMAVRRFLREARLASQLSQPNTVSVFDFGQIDDGRLFIAMELIRGKTLHEVIQIDGAFSPERTVRIGVQICDALEAAHGVGIVHRDLKLENVIVLDHPPGRDLLKVLDFGLAKNIRDPGSRATESGIVVGTPRYMSPEAATSGITGSAGDLYSLGVILGELASGKPLWKGDTLPELIAQKLNPAEVIARVPVPVRSIVEKLIAVDADKRPTAEQARRMLTALTSSGEQGIEPTRSDAGATTNLKAQSPPPEATKQLTPQRLATARTEDPGLASAPTEQQAKPAPAVAPVSTTSEVAATPRSRLPVILIAIGALGAVVVAIVLAGRGNDSPKRATTPPVRDDAAVAVATIPDAASKTVVTPPTVDAGAALPATVKIHIKSQPPGASVMHDGKICKAPCDVIVPRNDKVPVELRLEQAGRVPMTKQVLPIADSSHDVKLQPRAKSGGNDEGTPF